MRYAIDAPDLLPPLRGELLEEPLWPEIGVVRVVEDELAILGQMPRPGVEIPPHPLVGMVTVEPEQGDRLLPPLSHDLAARVQKSNLPICARARHVAEEGRAIFGAELTTPRPDEGLMGLHRVDACPLAIGRAACENERRAAAVAPDLDNAPPADPPRKVVEKNGCVARQPPPDRGNLPQLLRPIVSRGQACESIRGDGTADDPSPRATNLNAMQTPDGRIR